MVKMSRRRGIGVTPSEVRLSEHFLLSDFMGCNSVYVKGLKNRFVDPTGGCLAEGEYLCDTLLEPILAHFGPLSISYGYISPELSEQIVGYQDPTKPSYHRWDKGAAADICLHLGVKKTAPVYLAHEIDENFAYSRLISYSESPFLCVSTQISEQNRPRKAFYENRYQGKPKVKPLFVKKSANPVTRTQQGKDLVLEHDWRGAGYPTHHGGGILQWHHRRASDFTMVSDFLYSDEAVWHGVRNFPGREVDPGWFEAAGEVYDSALRALGVPRLSIVKGFERGATDMFSWAETFAFVVIPPTYVDPSDVAEAFFMGGGVSACSVDNTSRRVTVVGSYVRG
jgi:hypothetical protein